MYTTIPPPRPISRVFHYGINSIFESSIRSCLTAS